MIPPDEPYSAAEAAAVIGRSAKQVRRYLESGTLRGSNSSGRWMTTALALWKFQGIETEMMAAWRDYCLALAREQLAADRPETPASEHASPTSDATATALGQA